MSDFPAQYTPGLNRGVLSPYGDTPVADYMQLSTLGYGLTIGTWVLNRAVYQPVKVEAPCTITQMAIVVVTQDGNVDAGLYTWDNTKIVSTGSTACGAAGVQLLNIADTYLVPGWYKMAFASDSNAVACFELNAMIVMPMRVCGVQEEASAFPLPATATPAAYTTQSMPQICAAYRTGP